MILRSLTRLFGSNRARFGDVLGAAVIGDVSGIVVQNVFAGEPPPPPSLPWRELKSGTDTLDIFNLLSWRSRLSNTLVEREAPLAHLLAWAREDPRPIAIRLLSGPGGVGKSRLAADTMGQLREKGWSAGLTTLGRSMTLPIHHNGLFVAIDYPEANREAVRTLLEAAGRLEMPPSKLRILLISRRPMIEWQDDLIGSGASELCDSQELAIGPLQVEGTRALIGRVAARVAALNGVAAPRLETKDIEEWYANDPALHGLPLIAMAAAVHAVLDPAPTLSLAGAKIVGALVARERKRFDDAAHRAEWPDCHAGSRLHGLSALCGGLDERALVALAKDAPNLGLPAPDRIVDKVQALGWWNQYHLPAPQPDLIAAELLCQVLEERPQAAPVWLAATLAQESVVDIERLCRLMHDTATLRPDEQDVLTRWLQDAVSRFPERARTWRTILDTDSGTFRLAPLGATIGRLLLQLPKLQDNEQATILNSLSNRLGESGDSVAALTTISEAVEIRRRLAHANPARFEPELAGSLNNLSNRLREAGDGAAALTTITEAVEIRRRLAHANSARFEPELAQSLHNMSNILSDAGDSAVALTTITEAVEIRRRLAHANPARFEQELAQSLNNMSHGLSKAGDSAAALTTITEAVEIRRRLAHANPARFEPEMALILNNLSNRLSEAGDSAAALTTITEAVEIRRRLAHANPARFEPELAQSLHNMSNHLSEAGDSLAALTTISEAVEIRRRLAHASPARFEPELAQSLNSLSNSLSEAGDSAAALTMITEAVEIRRRLSHANPARFEQELAQSLNNMSHGLSKAGDSAAALTTITEAVEIRRRLAHANPARFEPELAGSLNNLSNRLSKAGDSAAALTTITEAVEIRRRLAHANPARFEPELAQSLHNMSNRLSEAGDSLAALTTISEAVEIRRRLAHANPARFEPKLAHSLSNLAEHL